jgi:CRP/FNR family transcriptional regulator, cyclic AMP receptor protein
MIMGPQAHLTGLGASLPPRVWAELIACGTVRQYRPSALLLQQDSRGAYVLALTKGRVLVSKTSSTGEEMIMAIGDPGEILGDMTVLDQAPRSATVNALTSCTVNAMSSEQFSALIRKHEAVEIVARHAFARLREAEQARFQMSTLPAVQRLACALVYLMTGGSDGSIELSQDQLARLVGTSRNTVVTMLASLRTQGVITTSRRRVIISDPPALHRLAAGSDPPPGVARAV